MADEVDESLAAFGLMREGETEERSEPFRVYALNWPTLTLFWATWNQWRKVSINNTVVRDSMDWAQAESAMNLSGIKRAQRPTIFEGLRALEAEALKIMSGK